MSEKRQKKIFYKKIGGDETDFREERILEREILELILTCPKERRDIAYRESYEKLHNFFISIAEREHLYKGANLQRALLKQTLIGGIVGKHQQVLEVGCGEGLLSIALCRLGNNVTGIDISDTCILLANKNKKRFEAANVNFLRMNAVKMDLPDSTFDWVVSTDLIEHLHPEDTPNHVAEAARILKTKGKYLLITPNSRIGPHAGEVHLKEYFVEELKSLFEEAGFFVKVPLFHLISPLNILVDPQIKLILEKLPAKRSLVYFILGLDPIVLIANKYD